jgi:hypothetical protein
MTYRRAHEPYDSHSQLGSELDTSKSEEAETPSYP